MRGARRIRGRKTRENAKKRRKRRRGAKRTKT